MTQAPPNYRKQDLNAGLLFIETKQDLEVTDVALAAAEAEIPGVPTLNITGTGVFGVIALATENTFGLAYTPGNLTLPLSPLGLVGQYAGDAGAFELTSISNWTINPGTALVAGLIFPMVAIPDSLGFASPFKITALAADAGVAKAGVMTFGDQIEFDGGVVITRVLGTITLSKTYTP